jgi:hypothetical protein
VFFLSTFAHGLKSFESLENKTIVQANKTKVFCSFEILSMKGGGGEGGAGARP